MGDRAAFRNVVKAIGDKQREKRIKSKEMKRRIEKFSRGESSGLRSVRDKKLKAKLRDAEQVTKDAELAAAKIDKWLLPGDVGFLEAEGMERTWRFKQEEILDAVDVGSRTKVFDITLDRLGPYSLSFTRNGRQDHRGARRLDFLPYHMLLTSIGEAGVLRYQGPVRAVAVEPTGHYMVTAGVDALIRVWDIRTFKPLHQYNAHAAANTLSISQKGMLAVGFNRRVQVWKDAFTKKQKDPYMNHMVAGAVQDIEFCPYEVPGSGEPNFDSRVADPYQSKRVRREQEMKKEPKEIAAERSAAAAAANAAERARRMEKNDAKTKMKGKNKPSRKHKKKQDNVIENKKSEMRERIRSELNVKEQEKQTVIPEGVPLALHRFYKGSTNAT